MDWRQRTVITFFAILLTSIVHTLLLGSPYGLVFKAFWLFLATIQLNKKRNINDILWLFGIPFILGLLQHIGASFEAGIPPRIATKQYFFHPPIFVLQIYNLLLYFGIYATVLQFNNKRSQQSVESKKYNLTLSSNLNRQKGVRMNRSRKIGVIFILVGIFIPTVLYPFTSIDQNEQIFRDISRINNLKYEAPIFFDREVEIFKGGKDSNYLKPNKERIAIPYKFILAFGITMFFTGLLIITLSKKTTGSVDSSHKKFKSLRDGSPAEKAVIIDATSSLDGIPKEYAYVERKCGKLNVDYKLEDQMQVSKSGRQYDVITIRMKDGSIRKFWFDITSFFGKI